MKPLESKLNDTKKLLNKFQTRRALIIHELGEEGMGSRVPLDPVAPMRLV